MSDRLILDGTLTNSVGATAHFDEHDLASIVLALYEAARVNHEEGYHATAGRYEKIRDLLRPLTYLADDYATSL